MPEPVKTNSGVALLQSIADNAVRDMLVARYFYVQQCIDDLVSAQQAGNHTFCRVLAETGFERISVSKIGSGFQVHSIVSQPNEPLTLGALLSIYDSEGARVPKN